MNLKEKFHNNYADAVIDIRLKAPLLMVIMLILDVLATVLVLGDFIGAEPLSEILAHLILWALIIAATAGIYIGKYRLVSNIFFPFIEVSFLILRLLEPYEGGLSIALFAAILGSFLVFGAIFIPNRKIIFALCIGYLAAYSGYVVFIALPSLEALPLRQDQLIYPSIAAFSIGSGLIITRVIFDRIIKANRDTTAEIRQKESWTRQLAVSSSEQMSKSEDLLHEAGETFQASHEIEKNVAAIEGRFGMLNEKMDEAVGTLEHVKRSVIDMIRLSDDQSARIDESAEDASRMAEAITTVSEVIGQRTTEIDQLTESASRGKVSVEGTMTSFSRVEELVNGIKNMAGIISDIAERTNLLAMNASIQAAHAGEAGKGFAVVAGEIRTLSESTAKSAGSIAESITELIRAMTEADGSLGSTRTIFQELAEEIESFGRSIREIGQNLNDLDTGREAILASNSALKQNSETASQQAKIVDAARNSITASISEVSTLTAEMGEDTGEINRQVNLISGSMGKIQKMARELEDIIRSLNKEFED